MKYLFVLICLLINHSSCLNKTDNDSVSKDLKNLFHNTTLSPYLHDVSSKPEENFAEGGSHNSNKLDVIISSTAKTLTKLSNGSIDLIASGVPSGTSSVKPRKGVHAKLIVARKGAPPCLEESNCKPLAIPASLPTEGEVLPSSLDASQPTASTLLNATNGAKIEMLPQKPTVTLVPADSDTLYASLKSERNVVIPIVALVSAPIIVMIVLIIYKRIQDLRGNSQYTKMGGYLIEDIYND